MGRQLVWEKMTEQREICPDGDLGRNRMARGRNTVVAVSLLAGMLLSGCGRGEEVPDAGGLPPEGLEGSAEETEGLLPEPYDFSVIEENHEILERNVCTEPRYDWEDTLLAEELRQEQKEHEEFAERFNGLGDADGRMPLEFDLDYFPFDFNDDGLEDYLVCMSSWEYFAIRGNTVRMYVQGESGTLREVLSMIMPLHEYDGTHARFTVLNEKTDGHYAIVLPGSNRILRYDGGTGRYEFHEGE